MIDIRIGDCRDVLRSLPDASIHCCVTSPPYFGLRDYGVSQQIGMERTPTEFVEQLVSVFSEVRRALRDDGTLWLNIGDSYAHSGRGGNPTEETSTLQGGQSSQLAAMVKRQRRDAVGCGLKPKDLIGIPWRVAFALQADGWYLRQDIIWHKPNAMPESVTDRCAKAHEYLFLLAKSERYYWDAAAMRDRAVADHDAGNSFAGRQGGAAHLPMSGGAGSAKPWTRRSARDSFKREDSKRAAVIPGQCVGTHRPERGESEWDTATRNKRSVWTVATRPFNEAHFATFPPALIEPCIAAGCREGGTVLDPFGGAGTTGLVADRMQRSAILIELNPAYAEIARNRISGDAPLFLEMA
jgi:DNA modification methylase